MRPWNRKFSKELAEGSPCAAREFGAGKGFLDTFTCAARAVAGGIHRTFKVSPMTRAKLQKLQRNAAVVLGNVGTADDAAALKR